MKISMFIICWLSIPFVWIWWNQRQSRKIAKMREHDRILFAFCAARDTIALKAIRHEVDEDSQLFDFFYHRTAKLIHYHRHFGVCFKHIAQAIAAKGYRGELSSSTKKLMRELKHGDAEIKLMAENYSQAVLVMLAENSGSFFLRAVLHLSRAAFSEGVGKISESLSLVSRLLIPGDELATLRFARQMTSAAKASDSSREISSGLVTA